MLVLHCVLGPLTDLRLARRALGEVLLVALALRVRQVVALVVVQRQAQAALVRAQVVAHEVRVLGQVDGLQRQLAQPLAPVDRLGPKEDMLIRVRVSASDRPSSDPGPPGSEAVSVAGTRASVPR